MGYASHVNCRHPRTRAARERCRQRARTLFDYDARRAAGSFDMAAAIADALRGTVPSVGGEAR